MLADSPARLLAATSPPPRQTRHAAPPPPTQSRPAAARALRTRAANRIDRPSLQSSSLRGRKSRTLFTVRTQFVNDVNQRVRVVDRCLWHNAMAEIENMPRAIRGLLQNFSGPLAN